MQDSSAEPLNKRGGSANQVSRALTPADLAERLTEAPGWKFSADDDRLTRDWTFENFAEALRFINAVGVLAEEAQHHPDIHLTSYRQVRLELTTHEAGGLSDKDFTLAAKINKLNP